MVQTETTIGVGDTVVWHNGDSARRTMVSYEGAPVSFVVGIPAGEKTSHTFAEPGEYPYFCLMRPALNGTILVHEGVSTDYAYDPPLRGDVNMTVDAISTEGEFGPESPAILSVSVDGGMFPALEGAMGLDSCKIDSTYYVVVAGSGNDGI